MSETIRIEQDVLNAAGYKNLASKAVDDSIDRDDLLAVYNVARDEIDRLKAELGNPQDAILNEYFPDESARQKLVNLIAEVEANPTSLTQSASSVPATGVVATVSAVATGAVTTVTETFDTLTTPTPYVWKPLDTSKTIQQTSVPLAQIGSAMQGLKGGFQGVIDNFRSNETQLVHVQTALGGKALRTFQLFNNYVFQGDGSYGPDSYNEKSIGRLWHSDDSSHILDSINNKDLQEGVNQSVSDVSREQMANALNILMSAAIDPNNLSNPMDPNNPFNDASLSQLENKALQLQAISDRIDLIYDETTKLVPGFNGNGVRSVGVWSLDAISSVAGNGLGTVIAFAIGAPIGTALVGTGIYKYQQSKYTPENSWKRSLPIIGKRLRDYQGPKPTAANPPSSTGEFTPKPAERGHAALHTDLEKNNFSDPKSKAFKEYAHKMDARIDAIAGINPTEANFRKQVFQEIIKNYKSGKISIEAFRTHAEGLMLGHYPNGMVRDLNGKIRGGESAKLKANDIIRGNGSRHPYSRAVRGGNANLEAINQIQGDYDTLTDIHGNDIKDSDGKTFEALDKTAAQRYEDLKNIDLHRLDDMVKAENMYTQIDRYQTKIAQIELDPKYIAAEGELRTLYTELYRLAPTIQKIEAQESSILFGRKLNISHEKNPAIEVVLDKIKAVGLRPDYKRVLDLYLEQNHLKETTEAEVKKIHHVPVDLAATRVERLRIEGLLNAELGHINAYLTGKGKAPIMNHRVEYGENIKLLERVARSLRKI